DRCIQKLDAPGEGQNCRREAEADHVGERIELTAEIARGIGHPRDSAIQAIGKYSYTDTFSGKLEMRLRAASTRTSQQGALNLLNYRNITKENLARREESRQGVGGSPWTPIWRVRVDHPLAQT